MGRKLVWLESRSFAAWGCEACAWITPGLRLSGKPSHAVKEDFRKNIGVPNTLGCNLGKVLRRPIPAVPSYDLRAGVPLPALADVEVCVPFCSERSNPFT